jgi:hypothetical protein
VPKNGWLSAGASLIGHLMAAPGKARDNEQRHGGPRSSRLLQIKREQLRAPQGNSNRSVSPGTYLRDRCHCSGAFNASGGWRGRLVRQCALSIARKTLAEKPPVPPSATNRPPFGRIPATASAWPALRRRPGGFARSCPTCGRRICRAARCRRSDRRRPSRGRQTSPTRGRSRC